MVFKELLSGVLSHTRLGSVRGGLSLSPAGGVRWVVTRLCLTAVAAIVTVCWLVEGVTSPGQVVSGSMAPSMLGPHFLVTCDDCGHQFRCGSENLAIGEAVVCPNCFYADNQVRAESQQPGQRFLIERATLGLRLSRRWEKVVFRCPGDANTYCVKRIVGLPGETVSVERGDVYINGKIARKTIALQSEMAILVHDNRWASRSTDLPSRWKANGEGSMWQADGRGFRYRSVATNPNVGEEATRSGPAEGIDYLGYHHWQTRPGRPNLAEHVPVTDDYAYNPNTSRSLHDVTDLMLVCRIKTEGSGSVWFRAIVDGQVWEVELSAGDKGSAARWTLSCNGKPIDDQELRSAALVSGRWRSILWSVIDRQIILAIEGQQVVGHMIEAPGVPPQPTATPLAIGVAGQGRLKTVEIQDLKVLRDIYYTMPGRWTGRRDTGRDVTLPSDGYYVLGDNSPISNDSRTWTFGPVLRASQIIGRPVAFLW